MFGIEIVAPAALPITAEQLRQQQRLNHTTEDAFLEELIAAAVEQFETDTRRPVLTTGYRQYLTAWPCVAVLGRAGVTAVSNVVKCYDDGTTENVLTGWYADLKTPPARVVFTTEPESGERTPQGYIDFTAGWQPAQVPKLVITALKLLAGHWYQNREAYLEGALKELPNGWQNVCNRYRDHLGSLWGT